MSKGKQLVSSIEEETEYFGWLSVDLAVKIFSKLPLKTIAKCRCVSKLWSSIIRRPNYNQLFPIKSSPSPTPRLLLAGIFEGKLFLYSSSQLQDMDKNSSLVVTHHPIRRVCSSVGGLVCSQYIEEGYTLAVITNPITGESITTPKLEIINIYRSMVKMYFGYDPVEKQFKVLSIYLTFSPTSGEYLSSEYRVLTLGTGAESLVWRKIECCIPCSNIRNEDGICINGVLYYRPLENIIVCFDVKTEEFSFINFVQDFETVCGGGYLNLIDYKGKLGAIKAKGDMDNRVFCVLWVLEDAGEHKWSKHSYKMPELLSRPSLNPAYTVFCTGMTSSGEIVLYQKSGHDRPPYIGCYNLESKTKTIATVRIPTFEWVKRGKIRIFTNFVEHVKLM